MLGPDRWERTKALFDAAVRQPPQVRTAYLVEACGGDQALRAEVESLLAAHARAGSFAAAPALGVSVAAGVAPGAAHIFAPGDTIGGCRIAAFLAAGGMGEVYRARDEKLGRDVAIKVLPGSVAGDQDRVARFEREARILATLNHPNIAAIYGLEDVPADCAPSGSALVLEYVEGETLADRLTRGPLRLRDALTIARQIADALDSAHEHRVIHRDLKPANIALTPGGAVKILDFGIATFTAVPIESGGDADGIVPMTAEAAVIGTLAYMSPEQARGQAVDKRTDIWAFGCVLYEMLAGRPAYSGATISDTIAAILEGDAEWSALPPATPAGVRALLRRCLQKDRNMRLRDAGDARLHVDELLGPGDDAERGAGKPARGAVAAAVAAATVVAAIVIAAYGSRSDAPAPPEVRLQLVTPPAGNLSDFAVSPDGRSVVYVGIVDGRAQLWLRRFAADAPEAVPGSDELGIGGVWPFWSPDSRAVAFVSGGWLRRVDVETGLVRNIAPMLSARGGAWGRDGTVLIAPATGPLYRVSAEGGTPVEATALLPSHTNHRLPQFLPDGRRFLFVALSATAPTGLYMAELGSPGVRRLGDTASAAVFVPPRHILFARQGALWAQELNAEARHLAGEPMLVAPQVFSSWLFDAHAAISASATGTIAFRPSSELRQLVWVDRSGRRLGALGAPDAAQLASAALSRDGTKVALTRHVNGNTDVWLVDVAGGLPRRVTSDPGIDINPVFSPDGRRLVVASGRHGGMNDLYELTLEEGGEIQLLDTPLQENPSDWSADGRYILYSLQASGGATTNDIWALPLFGDRQPRPVVQSPFQEARPTFSPDGGWIAYQSNETGQQEIYVQPFEPRGPKTRVSDGGGTDATWRQDGRELYYVARDGRLMAVPVAMRARGSQIGFGAPVPLFAVPLPHERASYVVAPDGQRFLINTVVSDPPPMTVLLNWRPKT